MYQPPLPPPQDIPAQPPPPPPSPTPPGKTSESTVSAIGNELPLPPAEFNYIPNPTSLYHVQSFTPNYYKHMPRSTSYVPPYSYEGYGYQKKTYEHQTANAANYDYPNPYKYPEREQFDHMTNYRPATAGHMSNYRPPHQRHGSYNHIYQNKYGRYDNWQCGSRYEQRYSTPRSPRISSDFFAPSGSLSRIMRRNPPKEETERDRILRKWCSNFCEKPEDYIKKMNALSETEATVETWVRSSPAELYYERTRTEHEVKAKTRLHMLCDLFDDELIQRANRVRRILPPYEPPPRKARRRVCKHKHKSEACSSSSDSDSDEDAFKIEQDCCMEELSRKVQHPQRVHADLWHNDAGEMNDGPLCRCSAKSRRIGIRHGIYPGEKGHPMCDKDSNNAGKLFHYRITISPPTNFLTKTPTIIKHDEHEFLFEGFSLLSHVRLTDLPVCKVIRFNIEYTIEYDEEKMPENFTIRELDLFCKLKY